MAFSSSYRGGSNKQGGSYGRRDTWDNNRRDGNDGGRRDKWDGDRKENGRSDGRRLPFGDSMKDNGAVEFEKEFYQAHPEVEKMTIAEVKREKRKEFDMTITGENVPNPCMKFEHIGFPTNVLNEFSASGYTVPTPTQAQGWPMALSGRDMVGIANTGSGKTLSFILPALIHAKAQIPLRKGDGPIVLILAPTRELVAQIEEEAARYAKYFGMRTASIFGGVASGPQKAALRRGAEIVIATPGRLIDLYDQKALFLSRVSFLILDEADRMLDMGFEPQLKKIIPETNSKRQTLMWSATWPREVQSLAQSYMKSYIQVKIGLTELAANAKIVQKTFIVDHWEKDKTLSEVLGEIGGEEGEKTPRIIIFCNQKRKCDDLVDKMQEYGWPAEALHGDKAQVQRDRIISDFKIGRRSILVATDVAARGLDVKDVKAVINYDFPPNCEDYIHRIGRTARGNSEEGHSYTFFSPKDDRGNAKKYAEILRDTKQEVPKELESMASSRGGSSGGNRRYGGSSGGFRGGNSGGSRGGNRW